MDEHSAPSVISAYRAATTCSDALRDANRRAIEARLDADAERGPASRRWIVAGVAAAAAAVIVWLAGDALWGSATQHALGSNDAAVHGNGTETRGTAETRQPALAHDASPAELTGPATVPAMPTTPSVHPTTPPTSTKAAHTTTPREPTPDTVAIEAGLLRDAREALDTGDVVEANAVLDRHRREFPSGALAEERWLLQVRAACHAGSEKARATAAAFRTAFPSSPAAARLVGEPCPAKNP